MNIVYKYHEGSQSTKPLSIDTNSSKTVVYLRRNVEQITKTDPMSEEEITLWSYEEAVLTLDEYEQYKSEAAALLTAKVTDDNISLMEAIVESYEQSMIAKENQITIMGAIADIYDAIAELQAQ